MLTAVVTLGIGLLIETTVSGTPGPELGQAAPVVIFLGLTLFSPIVETVLMAAIMALLLKWLRPWQAVVLSAVGWGLAHSSLAPWWGAVIWWPFLIFSILFVTWRRHGFWRAAAVPTAVHILQNLVPAIVIALGH